VQPGQPADAGEREPEPELDRRQVDRDDRDQREPGERQGVPGGVAGVQDGERRDRDVEDVQLDHADVAPARLVEADESAPGHRAGVDDQPHPGRNERLQPHVERAGVAVGEPDRERDAEPVDAVCDRPDQTRQRGRGQKLQARRVARVQAQGQVDAVDAQHAGVEMRVHGDLEPGPGGEVQPGPVRPGQAERHLDAPLATAERRPDETVGLARDQDQRETLDRCGGLQLQISGLQVDGPSQLGDGQLQPGAVRLPEQGGRGGRLVAQGEPEPGTRELLPGGARESDSNAVGPHDNAELLGQVGTGLQLERPRLVNFEGGCDPVRHFGHQDDARQGSALRG